MFLNIQTTNQRYSQVESTRTGIGRHHLAFADDNCVLNRRFAAVTVGSCDGLPARPTGHNMMANALSLLIVIVLNTTPKNRELRQKAVYFPAQSAGTDVNHCMIH